MALSRETITDKATVSIVILAYNEAGNLPKLVSDIHQSVKEKFADYEVIIVDDGSYDETGRIADGLVASDNRTAAVHNEKNMGCGYSFMRGVYEAKYEYVWLIPGDGEIPILSLETIATKVGKADMILPYMENSHIRPRVRRTISWGYTTLLNILFLKRIRYYNGPGVFPAAETRDAPSIQSRGFAFMAPIIFTLLRNNCTYLEVGIKLKQRDFGQPSVNNFLNIFSALRTITRFYWDINFTGKYNKAL